METLEAKPLCEQMLAHRDGGIGWISFNNPARRNAVSVAMWQALGEILDDFASDDSIRVIVLRGTGGKAFVSGADISEFEKHRSTPETTEAYRQIAQSATKKLQNIGKPTIAMIEGYCIGGGVSVAISCDLRIAADNARFGVPAAKLGLGYEAEGIRKLVDLVGPAHAREIFYTARQYPAAEALAMGLVNRLVESAELENFVRDYAGAMAANAPLTVGSIKTIIGELLKDPDQRDEQLCQQVVDECFASQDYIEGRRAFLEKRPPAFTGT